MNSIRVVRLAPDALHEMIAALDAANLPTLDVFDGGREFFRFDDGTLVGFAGIEGNGPDRLLRSLVVVPPRRSAGAGMILVAILERVARSHGVERLHLLTTTARSFFERCGYRVADRAAAPAVVANSAEFLSLCPASASYLVKTIALADAPA